MTTNKDDAKARLDKALLSLRQRLKDGQDIRQDLPGVGTLVVRSGISAVIFSAKPAVFETTMITADAADWLKTNFEIDVFNLSKPATTTGQPRPRTGSSKVAMSLADSKTKLSLMFGQKDGGQSGLLSWQDVWSCVQQLGRADLTEQGVMDWVNSLKAMTNFKVRYEELLSALDLVKSRRPSSSQISMRTSRYDTSSLKLLASSIWDAKLALVSAASQPPHRPRVKVSCSELLQMVKLGHVRTNAHQLKAFVQNSSLDPLNVSMLELIQGARDLLKFDGLDMSVFSALGSAASSAHGLSPTVDTRKNLETYLRLVDLHELCEACQDHRGLLQAETFARKVADLSKGRVRYQEALEGFKNIAGGLPEMSAEAFISKFGGGAAKPDLRRRVKDWLKGLTASELFEAVSKGQSLVDLEQFKLAFEGSDLSEEELEQLFASINTTGEGTIDLPQFTEFFEPAAKRPASAGYFQKASDDLATLSAPPLKRPIPGTPEVPQSKGSTRSVRTRATSSLWGGEDPLRRLQSLIKASPHNVKDIFAEMDTDSNGKISSVEFRNAIRRLQLGLTSREIDELLRRIDTNNDGQIDFAEFCNKFDFTLEAKQGDAVLHKRLAQYAKLINSVMLSPKDAFKQFDSTRSDRLSFDSFSAMFNRLSKIGNLRTLTQTELRDLFNLIDIRQDGVIDMREWLNTFKMSSSDLWEDSKQYEQVTKHLARHRKLILQLFEAKAVKGRVSIPEAREVLEPVLESFHLKEDHWRRMLAGAERHGSVDYRLFLDINKDRAVGTQLHPRP
jgi:Ca2+-binding EF-hand superfamily protein